MRFHRLAPVKSSKVEFSPASAAAPMFTPAETRHNFAIWTSKEDAVSGHEQHLYYCVRCKEAFSVGRRSGSITPLDPQGNAVQGTEAAKRLATFSQGPCPAFSALIASQRLTLKVIPIRTARGRVTKLILMGRRTWKAVVGQWSRSSAGSRCDGQRSKSK